MRSAIQSVFLLIFFLVFIFVALILVNRKYGLFNTLFPNTATQVQKITPTPVKNASITPVQNKGGGVSRFPQIPNQNNGGTTKGANTIQTNTTKNPPTRIPNTGPETAYVASLLPLLVIGLKLRNRV